MKRYFEYPFDQEVQKRLELYYEDASLEQHGDGQDKKMDIKRARIEKLFAFKEDQVVVDIGCSQGHFLASIAQKIKKGIGLDISSSIIEKANRLHAETSSLSFETFDGVQKEDLAGQADVIVMLDVLEHAFNPDALMRGVRDMLSPNGTLIIEVPFSGWVSEWGTKLYHQGHLRYYDPEFLSAYLRRQGFSVETVVTYNAVPFAGALLRVKWVWSALNALLQLWPARWFPYFGEIIAVARPADSDSKSHV